MLGLKPGVLGRLRYSWRCPRRPRTVVGYLRMLWEDFVIHPLFEGTEICEDCGRGYPCWQATDELWRLAMGGGGGLLCLDCFDGRCRKKGVAVIFTATRLRETARTVRRFVEGLDNDPALRKG